MRVLLTLLIAVCAFAQSSVSRAARSVVEGWDEDRNFRMSEAAKTDIVSSVRAEREMLEEAERVNGAPEPYWVTKQLVRHYCFDLRDRRWHKSSYAMAPFVLAWQQAATELTIDAQDVRAQSFRSVLERIFEGLRPRPTGTLEVKSTPLRADIAINSLVRGFSNRVFVATAGSYDIQVRPPQKKPCTSRVEIRANQVTAVNCNGR